MRDERQTAAGSGKKRITGAINEQLLKGTLKHTFPPNGLPPMQTGTLTEAQREELKKPIFGLIFKK
jgi:hypothetical protein